MYRDLPSDYQNYKQFCPSKNLFHIFLIITITIFRNTNSTILKRKYHHFIALLFIISSWYSSSSPQLSVLQPVLNLIHNMYYLRHLFTSTFPVTAFSIVGCTATLTMSARRLQTDDRLVGKVDVDESQTYVPKQHVTDAVIQTTSAMEVVELKRTCWCGCEGGDGG